MLNSILAEYNFNHADHILPSLNLNSANCPFTYAERSKTNTFVDWQKFKAVIISLLLYRYQFWHNLAKRHAMNTDNSLQLIYEGCLRNDAKYQRRLYELLAPKMLGVCMRYAKDHDEAQDIMQDGFIKIFRNLHSFRNEGSLEGWIRHIMINAAINRYRKNKNIILVDDLAENNNLSVRGYDSDRLEAADLMNMIQQLPGNYRNVFNMYAIEGYSHQEIGNELGISELLSRATLHRARGILKNRLSALQSREMCYMAG